MLEEHHKITQSIDLAVSCLLKGELVAFPTETVYGLGADATNPVAIKKVFEAKGRPADHPLIVHIADKSQLSNWAANIPASAWILAEHFWPGPLTMILEKLAAISGLITGDQNTIALRVPNHPVALKLLQQFGSGLVGPSANIYGHVSPTTATHVAMDLGDEVAAILDGGPCHVGIESTIIYLAGETPTIMRQGAITAAEISSVLNCTVAINTQKQDVVRTSGSHTSHYAPRTAVYLIEPQNLLTTIDQFINQHKTFSVLSFRAKPANLSKEIYWQQINQEPKIFAQYLYANLREHDQLHNTAILIEKVPHAPEWAAIADRLTRASVKE
jgi:L-threonylcarbamoyladenylate synthase